MQPTSVQFENITSNSATVQWITSHLSYTPEQYSISYGTTRDALNQRSDVLHSSMDITSSNTSYELTLQRLAPNTVYFFQLHSLNSYGETATPLMMFTTAEAGTY